MLQNTHPATKTCGILHMSLFEDWNIKRFLFSWQNLLFTRQSALLQLPSLPEPFQTHECISHYTFLQCICFKCGILPFQDHHYLPAWTEPLISISQHSTTALTEKCRCEVHYLLIEAGTKTKSFSKIFFEIDRFHTLLLQPWPYGRACDQWIKVWFDILINFKTNMTLRTRQNMYCILS